MFFFDDIPSRPESGDSAGSNRVGENGVDPRGSLAVQSLSRAILVVGVLGVFRHLAVFVLGPSSRPLMPQIDK